MTRPTPRPGTPEDVPAMLAIKRALAMPAHAGRGELARGGFLLGSDPATYAALTAAGQVAVLEASGQLIGFATTLDDATFRASEVWQRRAHIAWAPDFDPEALEPDRVAYFDQLAIRPTDQGEYLGATLALWTLRRLLAPNGGDHDHVFTTTLLTPRHNAAALPLMQRVGARQVGALEESYPDVGAVTSAIHHIHRPEALSRLDQIAEAGTARERRVIARVLEALEGGS